MSYYETIKSICTKKGIKIAALEKQLGFGNGTIGKWRTSIPKADKLQMVADFLSVPVSVFDGTQSDTKKDSPPELGELSEDEINFVLDLRALPDDLREAVVTLVRSKKSLADQQGKAAANPG